MSSGVRGPAQWAALLAGLTLVFALFQRTARTLGGFLFAHVRAGRSFWSAARLAMLPFVAVHLFLFLTMPWPIASAAVLLAVILSFPLAHLYKIGGSTIWASALLHFIIQGTIKVVIVEGEASGAFPLFWIIASGLLPLLVLLVSFSPHSGTFVLGSER